MKLSYSQKLYYMVSAKLLVFPLLCLALAVALLYVTATWLITSVAMLLGVAAFYFGYFLYPIVNKKLQALDEKLDLVYGKYIEEPLLKDRNSAESGMEGERTVFGWIDEIITDESWSLLKNQEFVGSNGSKFDIDLIAVGPKGIFVFEIKNSSYDFLFTTEDCAVVIGDRIRPYTGEDPRIQVGRNAQTIEKLLSGAGLNNIRVKRAVIFARPESMKFLGSPTVYLIDNKDTLRRYLLDSTDDPRFTSGLCEKVRKVILSK